MATREAAPLSALADGSSDAERRTWQRPRPRDEGQPRARHAKAAAAAEERRRCEDVAKCVVARCAWWCWVGGAARAVARGVAREWRDSSCTNRPSRRGGCAAWNLADPDHTATETQHAHRETTAKARGREARA